MKKTIMTAALLLLFTICARAQIIITVAGNGTSGFSGDGSPATAAKIWGAIGLAVDGSGNLYIGDYNNNRVRKVNASSIISTVAGNGVYGFYGDGGLATAAAIYTPSAIAINSSGDIYLTEQDTSHVRKVDASTGIISRIAGNSINGFSGDGGLATAAQLSSYVQGVAVDGSGNVYIADQGNQRIRKINPLGIISTIAGDGTPAYSGDGSPATASQLNSPTGIVVDRLGNLYIADQGNHRVRKINTSGIISTIAGDGTPSFGGDGLPATSAQLHYPIGVAVDSVGNIYIADAGNERIRKVNTLGIISTIAGNGATGYSGDGLAATNATFNNLWNVAVDRYENVYVADYSNNRVREIIALPKAGINSSSSPICQDSCMTFINSTYGASDSISWSIPGITIANPHSDTIHVCFPTSGSYTVSLYAYNISGCDTATSLFTVNPAPNPTIATTGINLTVSGTYSSFQWYVGGTVIAGATNSSYTYSDTGTYSVIVDSGGCVGTSSTYVISTLGIKDTTAENKTIALLPNPNKGVFIINGSLNSTNDEAASVEVVNLLGEVVYSGDLLSQRGIINVQVAIPNVDNGIYFLKINSKTASLNYRFMIEK